MENNTLVAFRRDIKILDATIRDGGIVNNFSFTEDFVRKLYQANVKAGVDYMEFGYKADPDMFNENDYGKWKFSLHIVEALLFLYEELALLMRWHLLLI